MCDDGFQDISKASRTFTKYSSRDTIPLMWGGGMQKLINKHLQIISTLSLFWTVICLARIVRRVLVRSCLLVLLGLILNSDGVRNDLSKLMYIHQDLWFGLVFPVNLELKDSAVYLCNVLQCLRCCESELCLLRRWSRGFLILFRSVPDTDPRVFWPFGSGSTSQRYGSGSGSFYHHAKIIRKSWILLFCDSFWLFIFEK